MKECELCKVEFEVKRADAKFCSTKCRKEASRLKSVTDNVTLNSPDVTDKLTFRFMTPDKRSKSGYHEKNDSVTLRKALYWYEVPIAAIPKLEKDWPKMPEYMNGRQYFLWWKNEFKENDGVPEIHNPFPPRENITYIMAGEQSRRWGA